MKTLLLAAIIIMGSAVSFGQTAHEEFMSAKIKTISADNYNSWIHGGNDFSTITANNFNEWKFSYLGLEGSIKTQTQNNFTSWIVEGTDITMTNADEDYNDWVILGENQSVGMTTTNWNTWVITGALISGISTTDTDDFNEWEVQSGDWTQFSPYYRAATVFVSVLSSSVLRFI